METEPQSGAWNMAVDEVLLETAISENVATLRWYQWKEATVSLGYFQKSADLGNDPILSRLPAVRRLTGGGAIVHDEEMTYCIALPSRQKLIEKPEELYDLVHRPLMDALRELGVPISLRGKTLKKVDEPLLCFQRQDSHDLVSGDFKVLGSAQRRRRGAILQHGSLIRHRSVLAPHLPGFADLCTVNLPADLPQILAIRLAESISDSWMLANLSDKELEAVRKLCAENRLGVGDR